MKKEEIELSKATEDSEIAQELERLKSLFDGAEHAHAAQNPKEIK